jgi:hypothetical protein
VRSPGHPSSSEGGDPVFLKPQETEMETEALRYCREDLGRPDPVIKDKIDRGHEALVLVEASGTRWCLYMQMLTTGWYVIGEYSESCFERNLTKA